MTSILGRTKEEWFELLDWVSARSGASATLTDDNGATLLTRGLHTSLCQEIRSDPKVLTFVCAQTNAATLAELAETLQPAVEPCEAGLLRLAVPIVREGRLVGQITTCGPVGDPEDLDPFGLSKLLDIPEEEVVRRVQKLPTARTEDFESIPRTGPVPRVERSRRLGPLTRPTDAFLSPPRTCGPRESPFPSSRTHPRRRRRRSRSGG